MNKKRITDLLLSMSAVHPSYLVTMGSDSFDIVLTVRTDNEGEGPCSGVPKNQVILQEPY